MLCERGSVDDKGLFVGCVDRDMVWYGTGTILVPYRTPPYSPYVSGLAHGVSGLAHGVSGLAHV